MESIEDNRTVAINDDGVLGQRHFGTTNSEDAVAYIQKTKTAPLSRYGNVIEDYFFDENNKRKVDGFVDMKSGGDNIADGIAILLMPDPTVINGLAAIRKIAYGILEATGGLAKVIAGFVKDEG